MSAAKKRTKRCPACDGTGKRVAGIYLLDCDKCYGDLVVCVKCGQRLNWCPCPPSAFDGDYSEMDRPDGTRQAP